MRQLIKFCLVGGSSTVITQVILRILLINAPGLPWYVSQTIAFIFGVINGFYWNSRWTFKGQTKGNLKRQLPMFTATNVVGLVLNLVISKGFLFLFTGKVIHHTNPDPNTTQLATICAIPLVVIWNFSASRFWTFKKPKSDAVHQAIVHPVTSPTNTPN